MHTAVGVGKRKKSVAHELEYTRDFVWTIWLFFFYYMGGGGVGKLNVWKWMKESVWKKKGQVRINELDAAVLEKRSAMLPWTHRTPRWPLPVCCAHPKSASPSQLFSLLPLPRHSAAVPDPLEGQRWRRKRQEKQIRPTEREWEGGWKQNDKVTKQGKTDKKQRENMTRNEETQIPNEDEIKAKRNLFFFF